MNKKKVDEIVAVLLTQARERGRKLERQEIVQRFEHIYSKDQIDRIIYRYQYMSEERDIYK